MSIACKMCEEMTIISDRVTVECACACAYVYVSRHRHAMPQEECIYIYAM